MTGLPGLRSAVPTIRAMNLSRESKTHQTSCKNLFFFKRCFWFLSHAFWLLVMPSSCSFDICHQSCNQGWLATTFALKFRISVTTFNLKGKRQAKEAGSKSSTEICSKGVSALTSVQQNITASKACRRGLHQCNRTYAVSFLERWWLLVFITSAKEKHGVARGTIQNLPRP